MPATSSTLEGSRSLHDTRGKYATPPGSGRVVRPCPGVARLRRLPPANLRHPSGVGHERQSCRARMNSWRTTMKSLLARTKSCRATMNSSRTETNDPCTETTYPCTETTYPCTETTYPRTDTNYPRTETTYPRTDTNYPCTETNFPCAGTNSPCTETNCLSTGSHSPFSCVVLLFLHHVAYQDERARAEPHRRLVSLARLTPGDGRNIPS
jgi:hypothetical protein